MQDRAASRGVGRLFSVGLTIAGLVWLGTGCGGSSDDAANASSDRRDRDAINADSAADSALGSTASETATAQRPGTVDAVPAQQPLRLRAVSAKLVVRIGADDELGASLQSANAAVTELGGFVFTQASTFGENGSATVTYKVPPARFNDAVAALSKLGIPVRSDVDTADVTDQVIDLDARLASAGASVTRVRALLAEANNLGEVTSLEGELTRRETILEQLSGQRRQTIDTVEMSTLALTLDRTSQPVVVEAEESWLASVPGFGAALSSGWNAFVHVVRLLGAILGYTAPFLALVASLFVMKRLVLGRRLAAVGPESSRDGEI